MTKLWCVHVAGPDDLFAAPDYATAVLGVQALNAAYAEIPDAAAYGLAAAVVPCILGAHWHSEAVATWADHFPDITPWALRPGQAHDSDRIAELFGHRQVLADLTRDLLSVVDTIECHDDESSARLGALKVSARSALDGIASESVEISPAPTADLADLAKFWPMPSRSPILGARAEIPDDGWLQDSALLYRLTDDQRPQNRDEINVMMADGSRSNEARSRRAGELLDRIRSAAPMAARVDIDYRQATELMEMFGGEPAIITLVPGDGHSGKGLYAYYPELPEEGAEYLGVTDDEAAPAPEAEQPALAALVNGAWYWVQYEGLGKTYEAPAMYRADAKAFYSYEFSGIPARSIEVMRALTPSREHSHGWKSTARLDEYDKAEWFDVARLLKPGLTDDQYEVMWTEFEQLKSEHQRKASLQ